MARWLVVDWAGSSFGVETDCVLVSGCNANTYECERLEGSMSECAGQDCTHPDCTHDGALVQQIDLTRPTSGRADALPVGGIAEDKWRSMSRAERRAIARRAQRV